LFKHLWQLSIKTVIKQFLSCDWGTSSFRIKLIETDGLTVLSEVHHNQGISNTYLGWKQCEAVHDRFLFFLDVIKSSIIVLEGKVNKSLSGVPVLLSGMASSTLGMITLPYKELPFKTDGSDLKLHWAKAKKGFEHDVIIISGVCSETDVMRGEETQLVGAIQKDFQEEHVYIFPGTHSKHITVKENNVCSFKTYMTGELFALLSNHGTLAEAVDVTSDLLDEACIQNFKQGVEDTLKSNLLHSLFQVRARFLLLNSSKDLNSSYLSGLLIGQEVKDVVNQNPSGITLVGHGINKRYQLAMQTLNIQTPVRLINDGDVTAKGQFAILSGNSEMSNYFHLNS
jgi:2-dehydro-3-deoxygalactonokinase